MKGLDGVSIASKSQILKESGSVHSLKPAYRTYKNKHLGWKLVSTKPQVMSVGAAEKRTQRIVMETQKTKKL